MGSSENKFDLIIIGGGPAGYNAAIRASEEGLKMALFEERALGGVCLNEGCIPTKTLLYSAKIADSARHGADYGVKVDSVSLDHAAIIKRKNRVVRTLIGGVAASLRTACVTVLRESAKIDGRALSGEGFIVSAGGEKFISKRLLLCTGSYAFIPPIPGIDEAVTAGYAVTSREILSLSSIPPRLIVIGGGVIGLELASYFNSAGSDVTVIEAMPQIAGATDSDISAILLRNHEAKGIKFKLCAKVTSVRDGTVTYESGGQVATLDADLILVAVGRRPKTDAVGLENIGVRTNRGAILTDDACRTSVPGVFAAGDCNGKSMLAHTAYREGEVAINVMTGLRDTVDYNAIPAVIYTNPEVADVGETENSAKAKGIDVKTATVPLVYSGRYVAETEYGDGILKLVVGKQHNNVLGVHMIGPCASEIIYGAAMLVAREVRLDELRRAVFPHPTVGEALREAAFMIK
jgi:dihydrolipoamide dehydrogenase